MKIPSSWILGPDADEAAQDRLLITQADIDPSWRGQYIVGSDTRGFVKQIEANCEAWNCWMRRDTKNNTVYVSEPLTTQQIANFVQASGV